MIPVEVLTDIGEDRATIEQGEEKVMGPPPFAADMVPPKTDYQRHVYGYRYPWGA